MKRQIGLVAVAVATLALACQSADAQGRRHHRHHGVDPRVTTAGVLTGAGATLTFLSINGWTFHRHTNSNGLTTFGAAAATTIGCAAVSPMVATVMVGRPLTMREGHVLAAGCVLPIVGPLIVNAAYDAHPEWTP